MYSTILVLHILSAVFAGVLSIAALGTVFFKRLSGAQHHARTALYALSAWLVFSGVLLAVLSPHVTAVSMCDNLALYFAMLAVPMIALQHADTSQSCFDTASRNSLVGAALLFIGTLALGL